MSPMALYNYAIYDRTDLAESSVDEAIVILNIGAEYTDLVVCTKSGVWQRCIPMGGNAFTKAVSESFKIHSKSRETEKKRNSKQIRQANPPGDETGIF